HVEAEVRPVADVDPEPARHRLPHHRVQPAGLVDEPARVPGEGVGQDVAGPQEIEDLGQDVIGVGLASLGQRPEAGEGDVRGQVRAGADAGGQPEDLDAPAGQAADLGVRLDAPDEVAVLPRGPDGGVDVDAVGPVEGRVVVALQASDEVGG